jgi:hypothetical protein
MTNYNFVKFEGRNQKLEDRITVTRSSSIGFPTKFYNDNGISEYKFALLFWDAENSAIGISFTNDVEDSNRFSINHSDKYGGAIIARSFFKSNNVDLEKVSGKYKWEKVALDGVGTLFVIKLTEE